MFSETGVLVLYQLHADTRTAYRNGGRTRLSTCIVHASSSEHAAMHKMIATQ